MRTSPGHALESWGGLEAPGRRGGVHGVLGRSSELLWRAGRKTTGGFAGWAAETVSWAVVAQVSGPLSCFSFSFCFLF